MKADALAQYLAWKRWREWFLIHGTAEDDLLMKAAIERAAVKFGAEIVETRAYEYEATARRTDTGHVQVQTQIPVFTQDAEDHDVIVAADESDVFGEYLSYRTWDPKPVTGTHGLRPTAWHRSHEAWGGTQMQGRFEDNAGRWMTEKDYAAWLAVRSLGEAVDPHLKRRPQSTSRLSGERPVRDRRLQGRGADLPLLEPADAPAGTSGRRAHAGLGLAAGRVPASAHPPRHPRLRSAGKPVRAELSAKIPSINRGRKR